MWIFFQLWRVTFDASGTEAINGLTLRDTLWYLLLAETIELSRSRVARSSEHLRRLLGDSIRPPFMGFVRGMPPERVLEPYGEPGVGDH